MRPLVAANWKMHGLQVWRERVGWLLEYFEKGVPHGVDGVLFPPATLIADLARDLEGTGLMIGAQTCHEAETGAYTGEISAAMLGDAGACYVLVGHSERRYHYGETNARVRMKMLAALKAGVRPVLCVGESLEDRNAGRAWDAVRTQLEACLPDEKGEGGDMDIAYEPVWSIGSGEVPAPGAIESMHGHIDAYIRQFYKKLDHKIRVLYGGSVKPDNARAILSLQGVGGALVGGASLDMESFAAILQAA